MRGPSRRSALTMLATGAAIALAGGALTRPKLYRRYCGVLPILSTRPVVAEPGMHQSLFEPARVPFASCHASTLAATPAGLACAWYGGSAEGADDTQIFMSLATGAGWSIPRAVAAADKAGLAVWNPVLWAPPDGSLVLFYKVGRTPRDWTGMTMGLAPGAAAPTAARELPGGFVGPAKNKPLMLADGRLLCPSSSEAAGWSVHFEWTSDGGLTWDKSAAIGPGSGFEIIQPTLLSHREGVLQALCRSRQGVIVDTWSRDGGRTWSGPRAMPLENPNSGIDAVSLADGRHLLAYNPSPACRSPLRLALSENGLAWRDVVQVDEGWGEFSYPAMIQTGDGLVHVSYTRRRATIDHLIIDPAQL